MRTLVSRKARLAALLLAFVPFAGAAGAQERVLQPVDLELVLAVDVSGSIDEDSAALQRTGYAAAITDARVLERIRRGALGRIAVAYVEWAGAGDQHLIVDWTVIADGPDAEAFASALLIAPVHRGAGTSISGAIDFSVRQLETNAFRGDRRIVNVSGDGFNWDGRSIDQAREDAVSLGVTINGLPILQVDEAGEIANPFIEQYFSDRVIGGLNAFAIPVHGSAAFAEAVLHKLIIEIAGLAPADLPEVARLPR